MSQVASCYVLESDGTWRRRGRGNLSTPAPPTNVTGVKSGTGQATLSWTASVTPGVTYVIKRVSWPVTVWSGSGTTAVITGLTAYPTYNFQVFAVLGDLTSAPSNTVTVQVTTPSGQRFPGDPNPTVNGGRLYWGCSMKGGIVPTQYETDAGVPVGCRHRYWNDSNGSSLANMLNAVGTDHAANRFPIYSWRLDPAQWVAAAGGSLDGPIDGFISDAAKLAKPLAVIVNHEPDGGNKSGNPDGPAADYIAWMKHFRSRITHWENTFNGGKKHPTLSFWGCWMGVTFAGDNGGPNTWYPGQGIFDVLGVDRYAQNNSYTTLINAQWTAVKNFMAANNQPFAVTEWGINPGNPNDVSIMRGFWADCTSGSIDCVAMSYFSPNGAWQFSAGELAQFETYMKDPKAIHMSDLGW